MKVRKGQRILWIHDGEIGVVTSASYKKRCIEVKWNKPNFTQRYLPEDFEQYRSLSYGSAYMIALPFKCSEEQIKAISNILKPDQEKHE